MPVSDDEKALELMKDAWGNIRHNENLRNNLFMVYLVIVGAFLGFGGASSDDSPGDTEQIGLPVMGLIAWVIGLLFTITFQNFRAMIMRDNFVVLRARTKLLKGGDPLDPIRSVYEQYTKFHSQFVKKWTVTRCIRWTTLFISAAAGAYGLFRVPYFHRILYLVGLFLGFLVLNSLVNWWYGKRQDFASVMKQGETSVVQ